MSRASIEKAEFWSFVVGEQSRSGLSVREFCRQEGVSEASLYQWRKKLASTTETATSKPVDLKLGSPEFLPVKVVPNSPAHLTDDAGILSDNLDPSVAVFSELAALQIVTPSGYSIQVTETATSDLILRTLKSFEQLREPKSC